MLIPIRHENMTARRWPVITLALIVLNTVIFLLTNSAVNQEAAQLAETRAHLIMLVAMHPELKAPEDTERMVSDFREHNPGTWTRLAEPAGIDLRARCGLQHIEAAIVYCGGAGNAA